MTLEAPLHLEGVSSPRERHIRNRAVARSATHAFVYVNAVIEINKIGQSVYAHPLQRLVLSIARPYGLKHWTALPDLRVTGHASRRGRDACKRRFFNRSMAIAAVNAELSGMMPMAKGNRLVLSDVDVRNERRAAHDVQRISETRQDENRAIYAQPRKRIRAAMKNLRHLKSTCLETPSDARLWRNVRYERQAGTTAQLLGVTENPPLNAHKISDTCPVCPKGAFDPGSQACFFGTAAYPVDWNLPGACPHWQAGLLIPN